MYSEYDNLGFTFIAISVGVVFLALMAIGLIVAKLYRRASKEVSYVRTGFGGQKVIIDGGSIVLPVLHEIIPVNMNTLRLEVVRHNEQALITKDRMRVDVQAEFYVRVKPTLESIADAAQTLGQKSMNPMELKKLVEGKFVDALRAVAAEMRMEELHEQRVEFVGKVQRAVTEDLLKNGLELETVSLTGLDQTSKEYFNPDNAFDAQGLTRLTEEVEERRKQRNDIEQDTEVMIRVKNLEAEKLKLQIARDEEYARLAQEEEVELKRAGQMAMIAKERALKEQEAEQAQIIAERAVEEERIEKELRVKEKDILRERSIETAEVDRKKTVELAEQDRAIAIAEKSKAQSESEAQADKARALAVRAQEQVVTVRETEKADREKQIELIEAAKAAEREAIKITVAADAENKAAQDKALATKHIATGDAEAEKLRAAAAEVRYEVEAEGIRKRHEADNLLSTEQIAMQIRLAIINNLSAIVEQSVKPLQAIEGIKIVQVDGLNGVAGGAPYSPGVSGNGEGKSTNLAEEVVTSALRYRAQAPLLDSLMKEVGISGNSLNGLTEALSGANATSLESKPKEVSKTESNDPSTTDSIVD